MWCDTAAANGVPPAPATCFGSQADGVPQGARVVRAAVYLMAAGKDGDTVQGSSGVVVRNSAPGPGGHNRILSVAHVFDADFPLREPGTLAVFASDGSYLGKARIAARSEAGHGGMAGKLSGEGAVLEVTEGIGGWRWSYDAIEGLDLAPELSARPLTGLFSTPGGIQKGASGSGLLDAESRIAAVATAIPAGAEGDSTVFSTRGIEDAILNRNGALRRGGPPGAGVAARDVSLPRQNRGYFSPVGDPVLLRALGPAGRRVRISGETRAAGTAAVRLAGFPDGNCIVYAGRAEVFDEANPAHRGGGRGFPEAMWNALAALLSRLAWGAAATGAGG
jgi:hypothetical protein